MNIQSIGAAAYGARILDPKRADSRKPVQDRPAEVPAETVEISDSSSLLSHLKQVIDKLPEVRIKMVEDIQARIAINDYPIKNHLDDAVKQIILSNIARPY